jgi:DNA-binding MarR family transcriptional regulator
MRYFVPSFSIFLPVIWPSHGTMNALLWKEFQMLGNEIDNKQLTSIMTDLAELHQWELDNSPFLGTMTGRHLYFKIAQRSIGERALLSRSLKDLYSGAKLSEKALRTRMRELERNGVIESVACQDDGRAKYLMPTEKFYEAIYLHAQEAKKIFQKNFLMIEK